MGKEGDAAAYFSRDDIEEYASLCGLTLKSSGFGPALRLDAYPEGSDQAIGYLTAFIRPIPLGLFQLETIQVENRRQTLGFKREGWSIDGPGISFIMGSWALCWAYEKGCRNTELLAVKDSEKMHAILVKLYEG